MFIIQKNKWSDLNPPHPLLMVGPQKKDFFAAFLRRKTAMWHENIYFLITKTTSIVKSVKKDVPIHTFCFFIKFLFLCKASFLSYKLKCKQG